MALLYIDGFDSYATADILKRFASASISPQAVIDSSAGRRGGGALKLTNDGTTRLAILSGSTFVVGFAVSGNALPFSNTDLLRLYDSSTIQVAIGVTPAGRLYIARGSTVLATGSTSLSLSVYYHLEFKVTIANSISAASCVLKINGVTELTLSTGSDTQNTSNSTADALMFLGLTGASNSRWFDDFYLCDGSGSSFNDFLGDKKVEAIYPTGDGSVSDWTANGASNDYQCVDEATPDGDTSYIASSTVGQYSTFTFGNLGSGASEIDAIQITMVGRKDDAGPRSIAPALVIDSTTYDGATLALTDDYASKSQIWVQNPDTSAGWTESEVNALEAGVKLVS